VIFSTTYAPGNELHLQYRCGFDIDGAAGYDGTATEIIKAVRHWLTNDVPAEWRIPKERVAGSWFYNGGKWVSAGSDRTTVVTDRFEVQATGEIQWAIRYERPESKSYNPAEPAKSYRMWRTDIGLKGQKGCRVAISLQTAYYLASAYFGPEPSPPDPTSPKVVKNLIRSARLNCFAGSEPMLTQPVQISTEDATILTQRIFDPSRACPLVYISCAYPSGAHLLDGNKSAWGLAGLAAVYVATDSWVDKKTELLLPEGLRCWGGHVRVYLPGTKLNASDHGRHRYFTAEQLISWGETETLRILTRSLPGRKLYGLAGAPQSIEDIRHLRQHNSLEDLRRKADQFRSQAEAAISLQEMVELLSVLNDEIEEKNREYGKQLAGLQGRNEDLELSVLELENAKSGLSYEIQEARRTADDLRSSAQAAKVELRAFESLRKLPSTLEVCTDFFLSAFPTRLGITERGRRSLRDAEFDVPLFWQALWAMTHDLHPLFFDAGTAGDIEKQFRVQTGLDLAMTEGKLTKADKKLMQTRKDTFQGREIVITPHVKLRIGQRHFRIYFAVLAKECLLVIGECTSHMDTAGTRRKN
jgi:hypothetical protein